MSKQPVPWTVEEYASYLETHAESTTYLEATEAHNLKWNTNRSPDGVRKKMLRHGIKTPSDHFKADPNADVYQSAFESDGNRAVATVSDRMPRTLDELIEACNVDLTVWKIDTHKVNRWGNDDNPNFQVKAKLSKIIPDESLWPVLQPIDAPVFTKPKQNISSNKDGLFTTMICNDAHIGYIRDESTGKLIPTHDRKALDLFCSVAESLRPNTIIINGDFIDLPDWQSKFPVGPELARHMQPAIFEAHWWIRRMVAIGAKVVYIEGNHEERMPRALIANTQAAYQIRAAGDHDEHPVVSIPNYLKLDRLGVEWVGNYPNGVYWVNENLGAQHGDVVRANSGGSVSTAVIKSGESVVFGHVHRMEMAVHTDWNFGKPRQRMAASLGCLCRIDGVVPARKQRNNWQQGFGIIDHESGNGIFHLQPIHISNGRCIAAGRMWQGRDLTNDIARDCNYPLLKT